MIRTPTALLFIALLANEEVLAQSQPTGMYLCRSPVVANDYWNDVVKIAETGVRLTLEITATLARKHECPYARSTNLKPAKYVAGMFEMVDGKMRGWASPNYYILYVNRP